MSQRRLWLLLWLLSPALALDDRPCYLGFSSDADDDAAIAVLALPVAWHRAVLRARAAALCVAVDRDAEVHCAAPIAHPTLLLPARLARPGARLVHLRGHERVEIL